MEQHWIWLILAVLLVGIELLTGTVYLLMIALGLAAGALAALLGAGWTVQLLAAALVAALGCLWVRRNKAMQPAAPELQRNADVHLDVGNVVTVESWQGRHTTVSYRGAQWQADLDETLGADAATAGLCTVVAMQGNRLILKPN